MHKKRHKIPLNFLGGHLIKVAVCLVLPALVVAGEPQTMDDLGFNTIIDDDLFSSNFSLWESSTLSLGNNRSSRISSNLELESMDSDLAGFSGNRPFTSVFVDNFDSVSSNYQSQGLKIKRLSTSWESEIGALTVGSDWANFQDLLKIDQDISGNEKKQSTVASQIKWLSPNGFSIALEDSPESGVYSSESLQDEFKFQSSPSVILSWQGGPGGAAGEYRVAALGTRLDAETSGQSFDGRDPVGWGLNLEGGWQIGDLFAALSVTYGKGINSYILQRYGNELLVTANTQNQFADSYSIRPSLYYSLNDNSNFHVALGHYAAEEASSYSGIDTLDTINMGFSWSPWPSTKFGIELVGQNADGAAGDMDDTRLRFGAQKKF
jgi:hypothetical protein